MVDPILIEQVLLNLLKNAAEAIDRRPAAAARRHIELRVVPRHTPDEGGVIEFSVTDMGPGMPEEVIARLYEAFFSTKAEGLGIGCRCAARSWSRTAAGCVPEPLQWRQVVGCRFSFTLPVELPTTDPAAPETRSRTPPPRTPAVTSE
jgi:signal transduction histidine kinase